MTEPPVVVFTPEYRLPRNTNIYALYVEQLLATKERWATLQVQAKEQEKAWRLARLTLEK